MPIIKACEQCGCTGLAEVNAKIFLNRIKELEDKLRRLKDFGISIQDKGDVIHLAESIYTEGGKNAEVQTAVSNAVQPLNKRIAELEKILNGVRKNEKKKAMV